MGLFGNMFFGRRSYNGLTDEQRMLLRQIRQDRSKAYRLVRILVIFAAIMAAAFLVIGIMVEDFRKPWVFEFCLVVFALCAGGALCLPWITQFHRDKKQAEKGEKLAAWRKPLIFVAFGLIALCTVLWVISVFTIGDPTLQAVIESNSEGIELGSFNFLRAAIVMTAQVAVLSIVGTGILRYGKTQYLPLRIIMYIALGYLDIWLSWLTVSITLEGIENGTVYPISVTLLWVIAILAAVGLFAAASIIAQQRRKKELELIMKGDVAALTEGDVELLGTQANTANMFRTETNSNGASKSSPEEQLERIAELRDKGIITEEEYRRKRQDIIDKM